VSRCLQMDIGNSSAKWRLVEGGEILTRGRYVAGDKQSADKLVACSDYLDEVWISSVAAQEVDLALSELMRSRWGVRAWFARTAAEAEGLRNSYVDPSRMGVDRWLAMLAARRHQSGRICVVDAGSALTIDLVSGAGEHEGGYIIPGTELMEKSLLSETKRVRFSDAVGFDLAPGNDTASAVRHGIAVAQAGALQLVVRQQNLDPATQLLICGGGGPRLQNLIGGVGELIPDLVFEGLEIMANHR
jgi:type III pantothenate kinase